MSWFNRPLWSGPSWIWRYGFAFLIIGSTLILSKLITPHFAFPGTLYLCAVMLSVWVGGLGPGLLASVLSTLAFRYQFQHPLLPTLGEMPQVIVVFLSNILIALMSAAQRGAKESLRQTSDNLAETVKHLQRTNDALLTQSGEREQAENRLRRSEAYLAEAQRLSRTGSFGWDVSSGEIYWSPETFRIFEFEPAGKVTLDLILQRTHPGDRIAVQQLIQRIIQQRTTFDFEHRLLIPDGSVKYVHVVGRPSENESGGLEFAGAVTDVSERKRAEEERLRLHQVEAELARINRVSMMGELAGSLAHEIKQPIAAAVLDAGTCQEWLARDQPDLEEARQSASRMIQDVTRASEIIGRVRSLYKKGESQRELIDINEIIREMIDLLRGAYRDSIVLRTELTSELPKVKTDRVQLQQVLMNLTLNAIEAMKETAGELTIKSELCDDRQVLVSVSDTGVGLPAEKQDQIFDAFFTTKPQGTGMGLTISRSIIEAHKGRLWASANPRGGATFCFTLPREATASSTAAD